MSNTFKIILGVGGAIAAYSFYKANQLKKALDQVSARVSAINNVKVDWDTLTVTLLADLELTNPTDIPIGISTAGAVTVKRIAFYNRETAGLIGEAITDISGISIEKQSFTNIKDIAITIPLLSGVLSNTNIFTEQNDALAIDLTLSILGKEYIISS